MLVDGGKSDVLTAINWPYMSLHSSYPGTNGANELSGGTPAYARKAITWSAVSGNVRSGALTDTTGFDVYNGATVQWLGFWSASTSGTFKAAQPVGGQIRKFYIDTTDSTFVIPSHGWTAGVTKVVMANGTVPGNFNAGQVYDVATTPSSDKVTLSSSGVTVTPSSQPGEGCYISVIAPQTFGSQAKLQVPTVTWNANL